jgi:hypothetical protein
VRLVGTTRSDLAVAGSLIPEAIEALKAAAR